ncbi:MAG: glycosyltransferase family 2 protein [Candidatus Micrarchaeaceae archaeon]
MDNSIHRLSIIIATIEEESVFSLIKQLRRKFGNPEIIIIDKSPDGYYKRLLSTGCVVIRQRDNGVENALMLGLSAAHGDILASIDADGTHSIDGIAKGISLIKEGKSDFVLGNRFAGIKKGSMPAYVRLGNRLLSAIYALVYGGKRLDILSGLFVMRRHAFDAIADIKPYRAGTAFFAIELATRGFRITEVPISYSKRKYGRSKLAKSKLLYGVGVAAHIISKARYRQ